MDVRQNVVDTGLYLLEKKLVARTWGNVSARTDETHFYITPSGLSYTKTTPEDLALYDMETGDYEGPFKPSSEKGIHAAAYKAFPDVQFVIHTHQTFASAFSLTGVDDIVMTKEEEEKLGGLEVAEYGLPSTKKLKNAVAVCFNNGAHCVLMKHHGAVVAGKSMEDAIERIELLEEVCKRSYEGHKLGEKATIAYSRLGIPLRAQLDDMAQMIGPKIDVVDKNPKNYLIRNNKNAVIVKDKGICVLGQDKEDTEALRILVEKAAVSALHTMQYDEKMTLSRFDTALMRFIYVQKYSKKKEAK
ncbi:MAG: class II aldolase/adducin family protein [Lachnospiraceae bacterium]|nr:class II aldolase/adducin family protein [Lachnospiraceae bacterium]